MNEKNHLGTSGRKVNNYNFHLNDRGISVNDKSFARQVNRTSLCIVQSNCLSN